MKKWLWVEWGLIFVCLPVVIRLGVFPLAWIILLLGAAAAAAWWLVYRENFRARQFWVGGDLAEERRQFRRVLWRFFLNGVPLVALTLAAFPDKLFQFPREMPLVWAVGLVLYPVLSVYPQELLFRTAFFRRYHALFPRTLSKVSASAVSFGLVHLIFGNVLAVALTLVGGWYFAETYARTRSLRLVCLEHALYGNLIFTVGLGEFFSHGYLP
jgi:uncharacterized protein